MRRVLALLVAVGLVVGAVFVRRAIDDDNDKSSKGTGSDSASAEVICATELGDACREATIDGGPLEGRTVTVEDPGVTAARLSTERSAADVAWLVPSVWVDVVAANRKEAQFGALPRTSKPLAAASLVAVAPRDRADVLTTKCEKDNGWATTCIADAAGGLWSAIGGQPTWGRVEVGLGPRTTTGWLLAVTSAVAGRTGRAGFDTTDLDFDDGFTYWFQQFNAARANPDPVATMVSAPGIYGVAYDLRLGSVKLAEQRGFTIAQPEPPQTAQVVLVGGDGIDTAPLSKALQQQGWNPPNTTGATPLPNGGVLQRLIQTK